jgi:hypothetical protein
MNKLVEQLGKFDSLHRITRGQPLVAPSGLSAINRYLLDSVGASLPGAFIPSTVTPSGKFSVRVAKYMKDMLNIALTSEQKQHVGNLADIHRMEGQGVLFDLTHDIMTWKRGSFGNVNSCYRGSYGSSIQSLRTGAGHGPGFTVRLFEPGGEWYDGFRGIGRCWALPLQSDTILLFNGYGKKTEWFANLLVEWVGEIASAPVSVETSRESSLYVNGSKGRLLGAKSALGKTAVRPRLDRWKSFSCRSCNEVTWHTRGEDREYCLSCMAVCGITGTREYKVSMVMVRPGTVVDGEKVKSYDDNSFWILRERATGKLQECEQCGSVFSEGVSCACSDN